MSDDDTKFEENLNEIQSIKTQYSSFNKRYNFYFKINNLDKLKRNIKRKKKLFDFFSLSNNGNIEFKTPLNFNNKKFVMGNHDIRENNNSFLKKYNNETEMINNKMDKIKKKNNENIKKEKSKSFSIDQLRNQIIGDPGRYNPNYNSIYKKPYYPFFRKSTISYFDQFIINKKKKKKKIKSLSNSIEIVKKNIKVSLTKHSNKSMDDLHQYENDIKNKDKKNVFEKTHYLHIKKKKNIFLDKTKTNLDNTFNKTINGKFINLKKNNNASVINFKNMGRKFINISSYGDNFHFYSPNYESILPHIPSINGKRNIFSKFKKIFNK